MCNQCSNEGSPLCETCLVEERMGAEIKRLTAELQAWRDGSEAFARAAEAERTRAENERLRAECEAAHARADRYLACMSDALDAAGAPALILDPTEGGGEAAPWERVASMVSPDSASSLAESKYQLGRSDAYKDALCMQRAAKGAEHE